MIDAAAQGAGDGLQLALNIGGMLIAFLALIAMVQRHSGLGCTRCRGLGWLPPSLRDRSSACSSRRWRGCMGVRWKDCATDRQPAGHAPGAE